MPLFKRAIEIDPKFAMAHASLGFTYGLLGEPALSAESNSKAYQLRDRASDREKFFIAATYDLQVTGNLEKALRTCELWVQTYPRELHPYGFLGAFLYPTFGKYEKGVEAATQAIALDPDFPVGYLQLAFNNQFLGRLGEAENAIRRASDRKVEIPDFFPTRYDVAFLRGDQSGNGSGSDSGPGKIGSRGLDRPNARVLSWHIPVAWARQRRWHAVQWTWLNRRTSREGRLCSKSRQHCGKPFSEMRLRPGRARRQHWSFQRTGMWSTALPLPWPSRESLPGLKHLPMIWKRASRRIRKSDSLTCPRFAHFSH